MGALLIKKLCDRLKKPLLFWAVVLVFNPVNAQINTPEDCVDAYRICDVSQNYYFEVNGAGSIDDAYGLDQVFCLYKATPTLWEHHSVWFKFTANYTGEFGFIICPDVTTDNWQFALFGNNPTCNDLQDPSYQLVCNAQDPLPQTEGCTGMGTKNGFGGGGANTDGLEPYFNIQAGITYILYANCRTYPDTTPRRATLSFQGQVIIDHPDLFDFVGCTMSTNEFDLQSKVKIYPNPFEDFVNIESELGFKTIELYDVMGKLVIKQDFVKRLDTSKIAKGFYLLKLTTEDGSIINKKVYR